MLHPTPLTASSVNPNTALPQDTAAIVSHGPNPPSIPLRSSVGKEPVPSFPGQVKLETHLPYRQEAAGKDESPPWAHSTGEGGGAGLHGYPSFLNTPLGTASLAAPSFGSYQIPYPFLTAHSPSTRLFSSQYLAGLGLLQTWFPPMTSSSPLLI